MQEAKQDLAFEHRRKHGKLGRPLEQPQHPTQRVEEVIVRAINLEAVAADRRLQVETVIGIQALKDPKDWTVKEIERAISPEGLTAVMMSRYHVNNSVKRELGTTLGKLYAA